MQNLAEISAGGGWLLFWFGCLALVWLVALINCVTRQDFSRTEKVAWAIVILSANLPGLIAYFIFSNRDRKGRKGRYLKAIDPVTGLPNKFD